MAKKRAFISFDFDHDEDLRNLLVGQAANPDTPFEFADGSVKEVMTGDWEAKVKRRILNCDLMIVICGEWTHTARGVSTELRIAQQENIPYFLLWGRSDRNCARPTASRAADKAYRWTWDNLKALINGAR
jgi:hypothetical protein